MARNEEKAQSMLYRFREAKNAELGGSGGNRPERRPFRVTEVSSLTDAERWRRNVIGEISKKVSKIQDTGLSDFQIRDLNDEINKLMREKYRWEEQIKTLGGIDYRIQGAAKTFDAQGKEVPGARGYRYFGRAKDLPGVKELFQPQVQTIKEQTRGELLRNVDADYYGYRDEEDGTLVEYEREQENLALAKELEFSVDGNDMEVDQEAPSAISSSRTGSKAGKSKAAKTTTTNNTTTTSAASTEPTEAIGELRVPTQKEVEEYLVQRRKQAILDRYISA